MYLRRHGATGDFGGAYSPGMTRTDARHVNRWLKQGKTVYAFFNNDPHGHAARDAARLARRAGVTPKRATRHGRRRDARGG